MTETEPAYIKDLRDDLKSHFDNKIENHVPKYFLEFKSDIKNHVDKSINELAIMIKDTVAMKTDLENLATKDEVEEIRKNMVTKKYVDNALDEIHGKFATMATKEDFGIILKHIGS